MPEKGKTETMLGPYHVLDLTEGGCMVGGKILGDLGADVIKIEPPGGSPSRNIGPFYKDTPDPEKSLFWFAYNTSKRSITLDIEKADGKELFKRLVKTADIVMETFPPGYMDSLGLGYQALEGINPGVILTSITPYGQKGPKAHYKAYDLTAWASGAELFVTGDEDRAPVWISVPQALLHGGSEGATASMVALWHRIMTGEGQHVDVSIQECVIWTLMITTQNYSVNRFDSTRVGTAMKMPTGTRLNLGWQCKDGYIFAMIAGGAMAMAIQWMKALVQLLDEEGMAPDWLKEFDWFMGFDMATMTQEDFDRIAEPFQKWFLTKTKRELTELGVKHRIMMAEMADASDVFSNPQLKARDYWVEVEHPELGDKLTYCGPPIKLSGAPWEIRQRAPLVGEHNEEIYGKELGLSREQLILLKQAKVI